MEGGGRRQNEAPTGKLVSIHDASGKYNMSLLLQEIEYRWNLDVRKRIHFHVMLHAGLRAFLSILIRISRVEPSGHDIFEEHSSVLIRIDRAMNIPSLPQKP